MYPLFSETTILEHMRQTCWHIGNIEDCFWKNVGTLEVDGVFDWRVFSVDAIIIVHVGSYLVSRDGGFAGEKSRGILRLVTIKRQSQQNLIDWSSKGSASD